MIFEFLKKLFRKKTLDTNKNYSPIIPDHRKEKLLIEKRNSEINELKKSHLNKKGILSDKKIKDLEFDNVISLFEVSGVYSLSGTLMITGFVETGRLKRNMKTIVNESLVRIDELRKNRERVPSLFKGEEGTLVVKSKKNPLIRAGDFLEFE